MNHNPYLAGLELVQKNYGTSGQAALASEYSRHGETAELRLAGEYVYSNFPRLIELSNAMSDARSTVRQEWQRQHDEEMRRLYPDD